MNIQAIICSFVLGIGLVLICTSTNTADEDSDFTKTTFLVLFIVGCVMTLIGGLGYFYTIYEVLQRAHKKFRERQLRKLEQQVVRRRTETMARTRTIALTMEREKAMSMNGGGPPV
ncbi:uncharacterized protein CELE_F07C6.2 [Caenorhabditis elegans]|uniref:Uncharacterized protein n=1 Tax=Caenorhabditis elegans TaxID=6239 RepID=Q19159_CAEEL|nr:Uncharacterized protein CELE_F07C6.2 [Caenorhabditis elegans]CAA93485.2 Uncharacterized protein CELE_F07C6.2 [Caenorhabditis elegans]|eukprot:NP_502439.2 Uncharacterized protein CELE_F07C6.2 [Caenorhabditis elegans]